MDTYTDLDASELVEEHLPLVNLLVWEMAARSSRSDWDGLHLVGRLALERAAEAWEAKTSAPFAQVATVWVRTALNDELQAIEWMACSSRRGPGLQAEVRLAKAIAMLPVRLRVVAATYFLEHRPMDEVATELGLTLEQVARLRAQALVLLRGAIAEALASRRFVLAATA